MISVVTTRQKTLKLEYSDIPTFIDSNSVLIKVKASGINFADIMAKKGFYPDAPPLPTVVGYEVSGIVEKVGPAVSQTWIGKSVVAITVFKGYATHVITSVDYITEIPLGLSFIDAASLPVVYLTAWVLIYIMGGGRSGQTLLIQNAGGGVGLAALDIAKHLGMVTIGTASKHKHKELLLRGLDHAIDYRNENVSQRVLEITGGKGCHLIIDPIGGKEWSNNFKLLRKTGKLGVFGASTLSDAADMNIFSRIFALLSFVLSIPKWSPLTLMDQNKAVFGVNLGHMWDEKEMIQEYLPLFVKQAVSGWIRPRVDAVFSFEDAEKAQSYIEERKNFGKVILVPTKEEADEWLKTKK